VKSSAPYEAELFRADSLTLQGKNQSAAAKLLLLKQYSFSPAPNGFEAACEITLKFKETLEKPLAVGIESVINLLAPTEPDRFFETPLGKKNLRFSGSMPGPILRMEDGWQRVRIALHAPLVEEFWVAPIETVSESEEGFERVYQGSQILAVWHPRSPAKKHGPRASSGASKPSDSPSLTRLPASARLTKRSPTRFSGHSCDKANCISLL